MPEAEGDISPSGEGHISLSGEIHYSLSGEYGTSMHHTHIISGYCLPCCRLPHWVAIGNGKEQDSVFHQLDNGGDSYKWYNGDYVILPLEPTIYDKMWLLFLNYFPVVLAMMVL